MNCPNCGESLQPSAKFCSACGARLEREKPAEPAAEPQPVKVLDAGGRLMLSGTRAEDVQRALDKYLGEGAHVITTVCLVGRTWTAACTLPPRKQGMEDTQSLSLAEVQQAIAGAKAAEDPEFADDGCRVEEAGFTRVVYGPSKAAVERRYERLHELGAELVGEIEEIDGEWVAVCDMGGAGSGYRWNQRSS
jgi:hypothetical protein